MKTVLPPQGEHDFEKIDVFKKTSKKELPGTVLGPKMDENRRRTGRKSQKVVPTQFFEIQIFMFFLACEKTRKNVQKKISPTGGPAECAGSVGGKEGRKPSEVCKTFCKILHAEENHAKSFAKEFMQSDGICLARRAGVRRIQSLRALQMAES